MPSSLSFVCLSAVGMAVLSSLAPAAAFADDLSLGGSARTFAMGGAGLALEHSGGPRLNPASLAYDKRPYALSLPSVGVRTGGLSASKVQNDLKSGNTSSAGDLLRQFGTHDSRIGANGDLALRVSKFEIAAFGAVRGYLQPNDALRDFARTGGTNFGALDPTKTYRADVIAGGYYALPSVSAGTTLPVAPGSANNYAVGVRVKDLQGVYAHYFADNSVLQNGGNATPATEMNGKTTPLRKSGIAADVGFFMRSRTGQGLSAAILVSNIINPGLTFNGTDKNGALKSYKLIATTLSAGIGATQGATTFAADVADISGAAGKADIRVGAEQRVMSSLAVRAGYSAQTGFTYGAGILGFSVAAGKNLPLEVTRNLKF